MFWSLLRSARERYWGYYEPFHDSLLAMVDDRAVVPHDPTHGGVEDKFAEFRILDRPVLGALWQPWFSQERFVLEREDEAADMEAYVRFLIDSAPLVPVLKFTRATFRVGWLRERFPDAYIVRLSRQPRDIWASMWRQDIESSATFLSHSQVMVQDIGLELPGDPYRAFYALMLLADELCEEVVDDRWEYEEAVTRFDSWSTRHLIGPGLLDAVPSIAVRSDSIGVKGPHEGDWYDDQERVVRSMVGNSVRRFITGRNREAGGLARSERVSVDLSDDLD